MGNEVAKIAWRLFSFLILTGTVLVGCDDEDVKPDQPDLPKYGIQVQLNHQFDGSSLQTDQEIYVTANDDTVSVTRLMYHINKFRFFSDSGIVERPDLYFLVDLDNSESLNLDFDSLNNWQFDSVQFNIGVMDSIDNYDGVLNDKFTDPMYWGMINGYINVKLEGRCNSVASDSVYLLHIGGYTGNYKLAQTVTVDFNGKKLESSLGKNILKINVDLKEFFENPNTIDIATTNRVHKPNDAAKSISENWPSMFSFSGIQ